MATVTFTATAPNGQAFTRTTGSMAYTHVLMTANVDGTSWSPYSWHKSAAAAEKARSGKVGAYFAEKGWESNVVPTVPTSVQGVASVGDFPADKGWQEEAINALIEAKNAPKTKENKGVSVASHRFNNNLRYREGEHPNQRQLTPPYILEPIREALGGIELDPCTEPDNPTGADRFYTVDDDGLAQPWDAQRIYCNPPYGKAREPWTRRCIEAASNGAAVVLLIPSHTDTRLVHECFTTAACALFIRGRVKFGVLRKNRRQEAASHPSVLFGWNVQLDIPAIGHTVRLTESKAS